MVFDYIVMVLYFAVLLCAVILFYSGVRLYSDMFRSTELCSVLQCDVLCFCDVFDFVMSLYPTVYYSTMLCSLPQLVLCSVLCSPIL